MKRLQSLSILLVLAATPACPLHAATDCTPETSAHEVLTRTDSPTKTAATASAQPLAQATAARPTARIPKNFTEYASEPMGTGQCCVVGATTDDDGMNERAVAYVIGATDKQLTWLDKLKLPPHTYQSRATHCTSWGHALFVLLQSDTQPEQTLSQTLLSVARLDPATGTVQIQRDIQVPGAFSAWVNEGRSHFQWTGDVLVVSGNRRPHSSSDQHTTFAMRLDSHLKPVEGEQP